MIELPDPVPGPGEVTIDVSHAAVGLIDLLMRQGQFKDAPGMPQPPFVPGLEVTGAIRALGEGVTGFSVGEKVVALSSGGSGGYSSIKVAGASQIVSIEGAGIDPAIAVSVIPNAAMVHVAMTAVAHLREGETVLVHGALGGFASAVPGVAKRLGASRVVGTVRPSKLEAAQATKLPYDLIVDSTDLGTLGDERFDIIIDSVGGDLRSASLGLLRPGGRLIVAGNASNDWAHTVPTNTLWLGSLTVSGFNAGAFLPTHPELLAPALKAAVEVVSAGLGQTVVDVHSFSDAVAAHTRMEDRTLDGRVVLVPDTNR
ncbi:NADPH2:quinone reductase [Leifsonia sp. AK011]|nr:NADPH2:quinone reductase [Leifsonia sp. AK011]